MAKQIQQNTAKSALLAVTQAIRLETARIAGQPIDMAEYQAKINAAMDIMDTSNVVTAMENLDDAVALQHELEAQAQANAEMMDENLDDDMIIEPDF